MIIRNTKNSKGVRSKVPLLLFIIGMFEVCKRVHDNRIIQEDNIDTSAHGLILHVNNTR